VQRRRVTPVAARLRRGGGTASGLPDRQGQPRRPAGAARADHQAEAPALR